MERLSEEKNGEEIGEKESLSVEKKGKKGKELIEKIPVSVETIATPAPIPNKKKRILSELQLQTVKKNLAMGRLKRKNNQTERILPTKLVRENSDDDEEDLVAVQKMAKKKKAPRIVYVSESESEEEIVYKRKPKKLPPPPLQQQIPKPNNLYKAAARLFA